MAEEIGRDNLPRSMKWMLADRLAEERLPEINSRCEFVVFEESFYGKYTKRALDVAISGAALVATLPVNAIVGVVTYFDVGRPIIFEQKRIGKNCKVFTLKKFRNMTNERDANGEFLPPAQRVTEWGKFVRKTSIDELLNFWSVFKGDMSIIGPRPLDIPYLKRFKDRHMARFLVRPGLECPPRNMDSGIRTWHDQFENDVWYVENMSLATDIRLFVNLVRLTFDRNYSELRGQAKRGDFLGYFEDGTAMSQYDLPDEYLDWVVGEGAQVQQTVSGGDSRWALGNATRETCVADDSPTVRRKGPAHLNLKEELRERVPDISIVRTALSRYRVRELDGMLLDAEGVRACEEDYGKKCALVLEHLEKPSRDFAKTVDAADAGMRGVSGEDRKTRMLTDMLFCRLAYGFLPSEYIAFGIEDKGVLERESYVGDLTRIRYHCRMNDLAEVSQFNDKYRTYLAYEDYYRRDVIEVADVSDFAAFCNFIAKHPVFVKKGMFDSLGRSVDLVDTRVLDTSPRELLDSIIGHGRCVLEEKIVQTPDLAKFNESSVNTVRAITFLTREGVEVPYCILRMGRSGRFVDNSGAGGIIACVDYASGEIVTDAYDETGGIFHAHPDNGAVMKGERLPDWGQLRALCDDAARRSPKVKFIGWDLAHTADGWVIVEGNAGSQMIAQQTVLGGMRDEMEEILARMDLMV